MGRLIFLKKICVFKFDIKRIVKAFNLNDYYYENCRKYCIDEADKISDFYIRNNYGLYTTSEEIKSEYAKGYEFYGLATDSKILAGMWIHKGKVDFKAPSFEALKSDHRHIVVFDDDTVYSSHNLVDSEYRGKHLYSKLLLSVLRDKQDKADYYIYITGFDNKKMIQSGLKYGGQIIGISFICRFFKYIWIRKYYSFGNKHWNSIER